jgi:hypothetical protein
MIHERIKEIRRYYNAYGKLCIFSISAIDVVYINSNVCILNMVIVQITTQSVKRERERERERHSVMMPGKLIRI